MVAVEVTPTIPDLLARLTTVAEAVSVGDDTYALDILWNLIDQAEATSHVRDEA